ncbi:MAG: hypothetical protein HQK51_00115 [Oligoflexia bacterium]|nr:hypothetical protein [Oligoflexia bacterium]
MFLNFNFNFNSCKKIIANDDFVFNYNFLTFVIPFLVALLTCLGGELFIYYFYNPEVTSILQIAKELTVKTDFTPEPKERMQFYFAFLGIPLFFIIYYFSLKNILKKISSQNINRISFILSLILIPSIITLIFIDYKEYYKAYFEHSYFYDHYLIYTLAIIIFLFSLRYISKIFIKYPIIKKIILLSAFIFIIVSIRALYKNNMFYYPNSIFHVDAVFYSIIQVAKGTAMLTDGLVNTYGLYAQFLGPIFANNIHENFANISKAFAILVAFCFSLFFLTLYFEIKNKLILYIGIISSIWIYMFAKIRDNDYYFQYYPLRALFPALTFFMAFLYKKNQSKFLYFLSFPLFALGILWNPDHGIGCFITWTVFVIYVDRKRALYSSILWNLAYATLSIIIIFSLYVLTIKYFYGVTPELLKLFNLVTIFPKFGYMMLPMSLFHPWNIYLLLSLTGIVYAIKKYFEYDKNSDQNEKNFSAEMLLVWSLLSIICLGYFQGRSHPNTFITILPAYMIQITLITNALWYSQKNLFMRVACFIGMFSLLMNTYDMGDYIKRYLIKGDPLYTFSEFDSSIPEHIYAETKFIRKYVNEKENEKVVIWIVNAQALHFSELNISSAINPAIVDLFLKEDVDRINLEIEKKLPKIFIQDSEHFFDKVIQEKYKKVDSLGAITFYQRKDA